MSSGYELVGKTSEGLLYLTDEGKKRIESWVTDVESPVYAFSEDADPQAVAAAMARLSRNSNDLRTIIASEFIEDADKEIGLLRRVVNQFGDDSVMQLYPLQVVVEGMSNLATKEVEWGRLAAYLEQSTRYLRFDKKDENGRYAYYTPAEFDDETTELYEKTNNEIFDTYSELYEKLKQYIMDNSSTPEDERDGAWRTACHAQACDGVRSLLPASTKATVGIVGSAQAVNNMIQHLRSHELPEMNKIGGQVLDAVRAVAPVFFERTDMPTRGDLIVHHRSETRDQSKDLAKQILPELEVSKEDMGPGVKLVGVDGAEDELVVKILADSSDYPYEKIIEVVEQLDSEKKEEVLKTYIGDRYNRRAKPGRAFEFLHYTFEVQCDYGAFRDIQRHRIVDGLDWQSLDIKLGHVTPDIIVNAGLDQAYQSAFKKSQELYGELKKRGYDDQAQYATLFGHMMRFTVKINARSLVHTAELRTSPQGHPAYRKVYQDMHKLVAEVHPNVAEAMKFVSQSEDEELARLGAEKYNQQKYENK